MSQPQNPLTERYSQLQTRLRHAEQHCGRPSGSVQLLAVSKTIPAEIVRHVAQLGQRAFGENYQQEATEKQAHLSDLNLCWHFIGPLQSNKSRTIAEKFSWLQSLDRLKLAQRLSDQRPEDMVPLNVCLQVNISGEQSKSGVTPDELSRLAAAITELPGLTLRGLMALPAPCDNVDQQRRVFTSVRELYQGLIDEGHQLDTLSMGMSGDLEAAVAEGATIVRIGSALFGARDNKR